MTLWVVNSYSQGERESESEIESESACVRAQEREASSKLNTRYSLDGGNGSVQHNPIYFWHINQRERERERGREREDRKIDRELSSLS
jgi:hypothetical protein